MASFCNRGSKRKFASRYNYRKNRKQSADIRYWVGGEGSWFDKNHWSTTSGGSGGASIPTINTIVVVDENSGFNKVNFGYIMLSNYEVDSLCKQFICTLDEWLYCYQFPTDKRIAFFTGCLN
ncbi:MAG: hypothetical protein QW469_00485 [Candidatus Aenigmatarchaeota archaeon]